MWYVFKPRVSLYIVYAGSHLILKVDIHLVYTFKHILIDVVDKVVCETVLLNLIIFFLSKEFLPINNWWQVTWNVTNIKFSYSWLHCFKLYVALIEIQRRFFTIDLGSKLVQCLWVFVLIICSKKSFFNFRSLFLNCFVTHFLFKQSYLKWVSLWILILLFLFCQLVLDFWAFVLWDKVFFK